MSNLSLAICILFHEKLAQTIECIESFSTAGVPIVVLNNGSSRESAEAFAAWCAGNARVRLLESPCNLGVSGGRNLLVRESTQQWLLFVDNDIITKTPDWLERLTLHVEQGVDVLIPRLYNMHEQRYVEYRELQLVGDKALFAPVAGASTNAFPGGASLINRSVFERLGPYAEEIFVGGEDFELAIRAMRGGQPLCCRLVRDVEFIHDHRVAKLEPDLQAVLSRYDKGTIRASYRWIKKQHGLTVEDGWEKWVDRQVSALAPLHEDSPGRRPRIALVVDIENWAFSNIADNIRARLSHRYDFSMFYTEGYQNDYGKMLDDIYSSRFDLVHFFWREAALDLYIQFLRTRQALSNPVVQSFIKSKLTFSVYDHCFLNPQAFYDFGVLFKYLSDGYLVSSQRLFDIYAEIPDFPPPTGIIEDGVDLDRFHPGPTGRVLDKGRALVVGWAGNSRWGKDIDGADYKGLHTIIKPAIAALKAEGYQISGNFADSRVRRIPHEEMPGYYDSIDVYVCASRIEGTPNPVLEAMACGVPVISTDVGVVPQLFGPQQQQFILQERSVDALCRMLRTLADSPEQRVRLSQENLWQIRGWTREVEAQKWDDFFLGVLGQDAGQKRLLKTACLEVPYQFRLESTVDQFLANSWSWRLTHPLRLLKWHYDRLKIRITRTHA